MAGGADAAKLADAGAGIRPGAGGVTEQFAADWLALREPFDHAARSVALARRLADRLPRRPKLVDLGGGTGSCSGSSPRSSGAGRIGSWWMRTLRYWMRRSDARPRGRGGKGLRHGVGR